MPSEHTKECTGHQRSPRGDEMLIELTSNPNSRKSHEFVREAQAVEPKLKLLAHQVVVNTLIKMIMQIPKNCPHCGVGND